MHGGRRGRRGGHGALETLETLEERRRRRVELGARESDECDLQHDRGIRGITHLDHGATDGLERPHRPCESHRRTECAEAVAIRSGGVGDIGGELEEEGLTEVDAGLGCELGRAPPCSVQPGE